MFLDSAARRLRRFFARKHRKYRCENKTQVQFRVSKVPKLELQHMPAKKSHHPTRWQTQVLPTTTTTTRTPPPRRHNTNTTTTTTNDNNNHNNYNYNYNYNDNDNDNYEFSFNYITFSTSTTTTMTTTTTSGNDRCQRAVGNAPQQETDAASILCTAPQRGDTCSQHPV